MNQHQDIINNHRNNNFDFLRQLAAFLVIYGHSLALLGHAPVKLWGTSLQTIGVQIFFAISGYLVTQSWVRDPQVVPFLIRRSVRIFPALVVCVTVSALIMGPMLTQLSLADYMAHPRLRDYFLNMFLNIRYSLPGVFLNNPYPGAVNGSLWSLPVEFFCYIAAVIILLHHKARAATTATAFIFSAAVGLYFITSYKGPQLVIYATDVAASLSIIPYFCAGSLLAVFKDRLPLRLDLALACTFLLFAIEGTMRGEVLIAACFLAIPYISLSFGVGATPVLRRWGRYGDFSYGMYLYSFPIQQTLISTFRGEIGLNRLILLSTLLSAAAAALSWHLVEKQALRMKPNASGALWTPKSETCEAGHSQADPEFRLGAATDRGAAADM